MLRDHVSQLVVVSVLGWLMTGCVLAETYEAEKARSLNFQRLLAQEEKRTTDLDAELRRVKGEKSELEARNRELQAQIQALREQLARLQGELAVAREAEQVRSQKMGGAKTKKVTPAKPEPPAASPEPVASEVVQPKDSVGDAPTVHIVQAGETLFRIARQYGVSVEQIRQWNNLKNDIIEVGQQLVISPPQP
jgi:LysM repeat protein